MLLIALKEANVKATPLKSTPANATLRRTAGERLRASPPADEALSPPDLRSALGELRIYEAELEIQNEELLDSRARIEESHRKYFRHFDLAPVGLIRLKPQRPDPRSQHSWSADARRDARAAQHSLPQLPRPRFSPESHVVFQQHLESALASGKMETCEPHSGTSPATRRLCASRVSSATARTVGKIST